MSALDTPARALEEELEIFGQQGLNILTPVIWCFPLDDPTELDAVISKLQDGLALVSKHFPWVAGKVVNEGRSPGNSGVFKIRSAGPTPKLIVRDLRDVEGAPTWHALEAASFPVSMMDEELLSAANVLPGERQEDRSAVLVLQANLIEGGLLLNIVGHHQALDGAGQEQITYLLDKACRGISLTEDEIEVGNRSRATIVPLLDDSWQPGPKSAYLTQTKTKAEPAVDDAKPDSVAPLPDSPITWANISFSGSALADLKASASKDLAAGTSFVSTDDVFTAFIWQSFARIRVSRLPPTATSTLSRAINPRRYLGIPANYPGYINYSARSTQSLSDLSTRSLGSITSELRSAVDPETSNLGQLTRELATILHRASDKDSISTFSGSDLSRDILLSSWAGQRSYAFDFGLGLGKPVAVRRPRMVPFPGLMYLLPKREDGEVVLCLCARGDELEALRGGNGFGRYGRWIG